MSQTAHGFVLDRHLTHMTDRRQRPDVDVDRLAGDLSRVVKGEVRFDRGTRALYATDGSNDRLPPIGVAIPRD